MDMEEKISKEMINLRKDAKQKNSMKETDRQKNLQRLGRCVVEASK